MLLMLAIRLVINYERRTKLCTTRNGHLRHRYNVTINHVGDRENFQVVSSTLPPKTHGSIAFLLTTINASIERYVPHMQELLEWCYVLQCL